MKCCNCGKELDKDSCTEMSLCADCFDRLCEPDYWIMAAKGDEIRGLRGRKAKSNRQNDGRTR